jgi:asparagine synthase (glutamine-hydrolysing)
MCGIAGILNLDPGRRVDLPRLERMRETLRHRGPDGEGLMTEGGVGLAHRRLAIMDPEGGRQPLQNEDGSLWIVCNGEIYNHPELRPALEAKGHRYRTRSDTETILHLYEEDPERFVEALRGMFAFALWDRRRGRLLLARDRLGIKPLYYATTGTELIFGSEIKAILASGLVQPALNDEVVPEFLATRFVSGERTFFRGVRKLLPGRILTCTPGEAPAQRRYWRLPEPQEPLRRSFRDQVLLLRERLDEAVRSHLMSDVPLGLFLSGGLDSTGLAVLMARRVREPIRTFSVGFEDPRANELAFARLAAGAVRSEHREVIVRPEEFFSVLPRLVWHEDEPIAFEASVPLYFVSQLAARHVKVVLTGEGADELFLGYNRYRVTAFNERLGDLYSRLPSSLRDRMARWLRRLPRGARRYAERSFLVLPPGLRGTYCENFSVFPDRLRSALLRNPEASGAADPYDEILGRLDESAGSALDRIGRADLQTYLVELLMKQDQMSMAASLESRVPYLDHPLVEHVAALPARFKLRGLRSKAVLRAALQDLVPPAILARRKMGFPVPLGSWLRGPHWGVVEEYVLSPRALERHLFQPAAVRTLAEEHRRGLADHGSRLWLLINLEAWHRVFIDREGVATSPGVPEALHASVA